MTRTHGRVVAVAAAAAAMWGLWAQWPSSAAAQVNIDVGGIHVRVGKELPPAVEVLTRGPVHEAFAEPVIVRSDSALVISRPPPEPIVELPPAEKPEGDRVAWIPGYWSWDDDRAGFTWVTGCWRAPPPGCSWIPGYWATVSGGSQWIPGFWLRGQTEDIEYLPPAPESLDEGPPGAAPSADVIWSPGHWVWQGQRYAWRPGFWLTARADWDWVPAHYVCSPRGCIHVPAYWDYPLAQRGVLFAPVDCPRDVYERADFTFSPSICVDLALLTDNLFCRPRCAQYYFGDYYDVAYERAGFYPWYAARDRHDWYDPIFVHEQWRHRDDRAWADDVRRDYDRRREDRGARPARTYTALEAQLARLPKHERGQYALAEPLQSVAKSKTGPLRFETLGERQRTDLAQQAKAVHTYKAQRREWESAAGAAGPVGQAVPSPGVTLPKDTREPGTVTPPARIEGPRLGEPATAYRVKVPKPPVMDRSEAGHGHGATAAPPLPETPKLDTTAQPRTGRHAFGPHDPPAKDEHKDRRE